MIREIWLDIIDFWKLKDVWLKGNLIWLNLKYGDNILKGVVVKDRNCIFFVMDDVVSRCVDCFYLNYRLLGDVIYKIYVGIGGLLEFVIVILYGEFENMLEVDLN